MAQRVMEEEGVASLLPGSPPDPWRFDLIPLPLSHAEFLTLEAGLAQRARLLDAVLTDDPYGRVACETLLTTGLCIVAGEITTRGYVDIQKLARRTIESISTPR